jgi:hypothetical protein
MAYLIKILRINSKDLKIFKVWGCNKNFQEKVKNKINRKTKMKVYFYSNQKRKMMIVYLITLINRRLKKDRNITY